MSYNKLTGDHKVKNLTQEVMLKALARLDQQLNKPLLLVIGGGGAMILAHQFPLATSDIDGIPVGMELSELDVLVKKIALELLIPGDWLNPYFSAFTHTLPRDYSERLVDVYQGAFLRVRALGREDLLVMKCFAHRAKDVSHARALIKAGADTEFVGEHIQTLQKQGTKGCEDALEFLDDLLDFQEPRKPR